MEKKAIKLCHWPYSYATEGVSQGRISHMYYSEDNKDWPMSTQ